LEAVALSTTSRRRRSGKQATQILHKPTGTWPPRVQQVGPEHFGILALACAKARSQWLLTDFYGKILVPAPVGEHNRLAFEATVAQLRQALHAHDLRDLLVALERTGRSHRPVQGAFASAGFATRIVRPFATKQLRQPANPGAKTDATDLAAIQRAATIGFALSTQEFS
jgi:hypothetical protein